MINDEGHIVNGGAVLVVRKLGFGRGVECRSLVVTEYLAGVG